MIIPTVKIKHKEGFKVINECNFDPKKNKIYVDTPEPEPATREPGVKEPESTPEKTKPMTRAKGGKATKAKSAKVTKAKG